MSLYKIQMIYQKIDIYFNKYYISKMGNYIYTKHYPIISKKDFNKSKRILLKYGNKVIDATDYITLHPGGEKCLKNRNKKDIKRDFEFHSKNAKNLIKSMIVYELK